MEDIDSFKIKRLTLSFAISRMIKKLNELHPLYKSIIITYPLNPQTFSCARNSLLSIWEDYCNLFCTPHNLISYNKYIDLLSLSNPGTLYSLESTYPSINFVVLLNANNSIPEMTFESLKSLKNQSHKKFIVRLFINQHNDHNKSVYYTRAVNEILRANNFSFDVDICSNFFEIAPINAPQWTIYIESGVTLLSHALETFSVAINKHSQSSIFYVDQDLIDSSGCRSNHCFKSDWNPDLFLSQNMFSHLGVYRTDLVRSVGGFRVGLEGSQDYDLALRCIEQIKPEQIHHIPRVLYHWRMHADSTAHDLNAKPYAIVAGERALNDHFKRIGSQAWAESVKEGYRVHYPLPAPLPLVSLIIPTRNGLKLLKQCIDSILQKTNYTQYEIIIVDNGSDDSATLRYLRKIIADPRIRVIRDESPFNYSALNNHAVREARGEIIGLINNDIEVITPEWLSEMVSHAVRPEVGAVGARLWYSDDTIQHAGIILGMMGFAGHAHRHLPKGNPGYCGRAALTQSFSAVTGACLVVRKELYELVGGLNEIDLQVACNDVDFCLKLREAGYRNIWTPYAELYHHESSSRGFDDTPEKVARAEREVAYMKAHWGPLLENDPAYNPNLSLDNEDFTLAWPPRLPGILSDIDETVTQQ